MWAFRPSKRVKRSDDADADGHNDAEVSESVFDSFQPQPQVGEKSSSSSLSLSLNMDEEEEEKEKEKEDENMELDEEINHTKEEQDVSAIHVSHSSSSRRSRSLKRSRSPFRSFDHESDREEAKDEQGDESSSWIAQLNARERELRSVPRENLFDSLVLHDGRVTEETKDLASGYVIQVPPSINRKLRPYQREGVKWLFKQWRHNLGGILGDEMGLGKTIQVIAFIDALVNRQYRCTPLPDSSSSSSVVASSSSPFSPILLIAPATILTQWSNEFRDWSPLLRVKLAYGAEKERSFEAAAAKRVDVIISSYETCLSQLAVINRIAWEFCIFDEVHRLKNYEAKSTIAFRNQLHIKIRFGLTGTLIQNNYIELWCVIHVIQAQGSLSSRSLVEFKNYFDTPIKLGQKYGASLSAIHLKDSRLHQLNEWINSVMLRREKKILSHQLPSKEDNIVFCRLSDIQIRCYRRMIESRDVKAILSGTFDSRGIMCRTFEKHKVGMGMYAPCCRSCPSCLILPCITYLGKIANHLSMMQLEHVPNDPHEEYYQAQKLGNETAIGIAKQRIEVEARHLEMNSAAPEVFKRRRARLIAKMALGEDIESIGGLYRTPAVLSSANEESCGKLQALRSLLRVWYAQSEPRSKILLFSNSTVTLDILAAFIVRLGYVFRRIDGNTPNKRRNEIVQEFHDNEAIFVLLLSTRAGGVGLNLTCANVVVIFDPNWNPSNDLQSQDRSYRIGQTQNVRVYRLIASGTIEEQIYLRQLYKQQLAILALHPETKQRRYFTGVMKIRDKQGELFGVKNLFDFKPMTGFSNSVIEREQELEQGYTIKMDALRKLKDKSEAMGVGSSSESGTTDQVDTSAMVMNANHMKDTQQGLDDSDEGRKLEDGSTLDAEHPLLPLTDSPPAVSAATSTTEAIDLASFAPLPVDVDDKDKLLDEYALSFVPLFMPDHAGDTQASQLDSDKDAEVDLSVLMCDIDGDDSIDADESRVSRTSTKTSSSRSGAPSKFGPSSAEIHRLLTESGMVHTHEFQQVTKGSKMEKNISATAKIVQKDKSTTIGASTRRHPSVIGRFENTTIDVKSSPSSSVANANRNTASRKSSITSPLAMVLLKSSSPIHHCVRKQSSSTETLVSSSESRTANSPVSLFEVQAAQEPLSVHYSPIPVSSEDQHPSQVEPSPGTCEAPAPPSEASHSSASPDEPSASQKALPSALSSKMIAFQKLASRCGFESAEELSRYLKENNATKDDIQRLIQEASRK